MKKLMVLLGLMIFGLIPLVSAGECVQEGYQYCWEDSRMEDGKNLYAKVYYNLVDVGFSQFNTNAGESGYAIKFLEARGGFVGDEVYYAENTNLQEIEDSCERGAPEHECEGLEFLAGIPRTFTKTLVTFQQGGQEYDMSPMFVVLNNRPGNDRRIWTFAAHGWERGNELNVKVINDCYSDNQCSNNYTCDTSSQDWGEWHCTSAECTPGENRCLDNQQQICEDNSKWSEPKYESGSCGVECTKDNECGFNSICSNYQCINGGMEEQEEQSGGEQNKSGGDGQDDGGFGGGVSNGSPGFGSLVTAGIIILILASIVGILVYVRRRG